jgi:hydrophobic/amphiphilic exporter-1 (mainly G- bacteria), HAE1 family
VIPQEEIATLISNIGLPVGKGAGFSTVLSPNSGPDSAFLIVNLNEHGRKTSSEQYIRRLRERLKKDLPEQQFLFVSGGIVNAALNEGSPVPIDIQVSASSLEKCREAAEQVVDKMKAIPGTADVQIAQALDYPQLDIHVDRARAKFLGIDQREVAQTILTALASSVGYAPAIWIDPKTGIDFFMGVQYKDNSLQSLEELGNVPVSLKRTDGTTTTIPLSNIAEIQRVNIPAEIKHYNISRTYDVYVHAAGRDMGSVAADVNRELKNMKLAGVTTSVHGPVETMKAGGRDLGAGILVATVLMYLVLMAQFRSFLDPFIIVLAVPLALSGVLATLFVTGTTLNIQSMVGTLMMIGVAIHNSILLVEFANRLMERGYDIHAAAIGAAQIRLRPILMTAFVLAASMAPMAFHFAPGGEAMVPLARAVIGGMLVSTFLTLFLVPCVYTLLKGRHAAVVA